jgi:hypothetical protein
VNEQTLIEAEILRLTDAADDGKSICPTEIARAVMPGPGDLWRQKLSAVRRAATRLAEAGRIDILRKGRPVDRAGLAAAGVKGVIRLCRRAPISPES